MPGDFTDSKVDPAGPRDRVRHRDQNANFKLTGFHEAHGIRCFLYQCQQHDGSTTEFTVEADLGLLRKYGITLQELPLLCRNLLEKQSPGSALTAITFGEELMKEQADQRAAVKHAAELRKKHYRRGVRPPDPGQDRR
ncbi:MAG TPA: hypothetical protein VKT49_24085 [Bryobacteraceae bacterium]|nr:hypothetical protein [Bryobacteraceae bacterium]